MSILKTRITSSPPAGADGVTVLSRRLTNAEVDENFLSLYERKLETSGGTLTGHLTLHADPTTALHAATKQYVDDAADAAVANHQTASGAHDASSIAFAGGAWPDVQAAIDGHIADASAHTASAISYADTGGLTGQIDVQGAVYVLADAFADHLVPPLGAYPHTAGQVQFIPVGNIAATTVQSALYELDTEKVAKAGDAATGLAITGSYTPAGGGALELHYLGGAGWVQAMDRTGSVYKPLWLVGSYVNAGVTSGGDTIPALATTYVAGEITSQKNGASDYGLLRLSAGGGGTLGVKSAIDIQGNGATNGPQIRFYTAGVERAQMIGGAFGIQDGVTAPTTRTGFAYIYVDSADGDLKVRFGDGVTKTLATDS